MTNKLWTNNFILITIVNLLLFFGFQIILATLPLQIKDLGGTDAIVGWISGAATIASLIVRPFAGRFLDKLNRKFILILGIIFIMIVTSFYGFISAIYLILIIRFLHGLGWGVASTASNTLATEQIPKKRFGEGMGFFGLSSSLAMAIAPALSLALFSNYGFLSVTFLSVFAGLITIFVIIFLKYEYSIKNTEINKKDSFYEKSAILPAITMFFVTASYGTIVGFIAIFSRQQKIENIGMFFSVYAIFVLLIRPISGKLLDKFGNSVVVLPSIVLLIIALLVISYSNTLLLILIGAALYGVGFGAVQSSLQTMAVAFASKDRRGAATATFYTGFDAGIGFGSIVGGLIASSLGYSLMYQIFALLLLISFFLFIFVNKMNRT